MTHTDPDGHRSRGLDFSEQAFKLLYGQQLGAIAEAWWEEDITDGQFLDEVGIQFSSWDDSVVSNDLIGTITSEDGAEPNVEERSVALSLSLVGNNVKYLKTRNDPKSPQNTPDFEVNGIRTELKTAYPKSEGYDEPQSLNRNSAITKLSEAFKKQGATNVIYDMRNVKNYNVLDILFTCKCGMVLSNSADPNEIQLRVFTDKEWHKILFLTYVEEIDLPELDVWKCPNCLRLYFFEGNILTHTYILETQT